jgi:predicted DNA-binding protein
MPQKNQIVGFRVDDETDEVLEDMMWEHRTTKADIMRAMVNRFLEDEELQSEIIQRIKDDPQEDDD